MLAESRRRALSYIIAGPQETRRHQIAAQPSQALQSFLAKKGQLARKPAIRPLEHSSRPLRIKEPLQAAQRKAVSEDRTHKLPKLGGKLLSLPAAATIEQVFAQPCSGSGASLTQIYLPTGMIHLYHHHHFSWIFLQYLTTFSAHR